MIQKQLLQESIKDTQTAMHELRKAVLNPGTEQTNIAFYLGCLEAEINRLIRTIEL